MMGSLFRSPAVTDSRHSHGTFVSRMTLATAKCPVDLFNWAKFIVYFSIDSLKKRILSPIKKPLYSFFIFT